MKLFKYLTAILVLILTIISCDNDDDNGPGTVELRDLEEVRLENNDTIIAFLQDYYYELIDNPLHPNFQELVFNEIPEEGENSDRPPIIDSPFLQSKEVTQQDVTYTLYYLKLREGNTATRNPKFADSTLLTYKGMTLRNTIFDSSPNPIWLDLTQTIRGFYELLPELFGSSGFVENGDGTVDFNDDFGIGAVFIPSGLGYFASPPSGSGILRYEPIIFSVQLYKSKESDHDQDGIPSWMEDFNDNGRVNDFFSSTDLQDDGDDTDRDQIFNYLDIDDDGDGVLTIDEIIINEDGSVDFIYSDSNNPDLADHLNPNIAVDNS